MKALSVRLYGMYAPLVRNERVGTVMRKAFEKSNHLVYKASRGKLWNKMGDAQIVLITTTGRKTGKLREFPLLSVPRGASWIIVGSNAGRPTDPAWVANVRAKPDLVVTVKTTQLFVRAREVVDQQEYAECWAEMVRAYANYSDYAVSTDRRLPIFVLAPR